MRSPILSISSRVAILALAACAIDAPDADGATCVARTRFDAHDPQGAVLPSCWRDLPLCASATEASASGAKLMNMSRQQTRRICADR